MSLKKEKTTKNQSKKWKFDRKKNKNKRKKTNWVLQRTHLLTSIPNIPTVGEQRDGWIEFSAYNYMGYRIGTGCGGGCGGTFTLKRIE